MTLHEQVLIPLTVAAPQLMEGMPVKQYAPADIKYLEDQVRLHRIPIAQGDHYIDIDHYIDMVYHAIFGAHKVLQDSSKKIPDTRK